MTFSTKSLAYADSADDLTFTEIAREKKYLGGADEGELKVLTALPALKNKKTRKQAFIGRTSTRLPVSVLALPNILLA